MISGFRKSAMNNIVISSSFIFIGLMLVLKPTETINTIIYILGAIFITFGVIQIIQYIRLDSKSINFSFNLLYGIMGIVSGIAIIVFGAAVVSLFRVIIGIWIIYSAVVRFNLAISLKNTINDAWVYALIFSIIMFLCGLFITFNSGAILSTIGIIMIVYSVIELAQNYIVLKNIKVIEKK
ncbi:MAG: DUF308 domain-containing protein [Clostridia bacterium]|nr:DUF308 domain-containing protein [Clostridia bacterium]